MIYFLFLCLAKTIIVDTEEHFWFRGNARISGDTAKAEDGQPRCRHDEIQLKL